MLIDYDERVMKLNKNVDFFLKYHVARYCFYYVFWAAQLGSESR